MTLPKGLISEPAFQRYSREHLSIINDEHWFGDDLPYLNEKFSASKVLANREIVARILLRAAKHAEREGGGGEPYYVLAEKLQTCRPRYRCGSSACPMCARAFQLAKTAATLDLIKVREDIGTHGKPVFVTIIPHWLTYEPDQFNQIDILKANRWLKDQLERVGQRMIVGSADLGWETRRGGRYIQIHWHLVFWTKNPEELKLKLKELFPRRRKYEQPIKVIVPKNLNFIAYQNKMIKLPSLLRVMRRHLAELMIALDRTDPLDVLVLKQTRISSLSDRLIFAV